jgi:hypothetical protein
MSWTPEELMTYVRNRESTEVRLTSLNYHRCPSLCAVTLTEHEVQTFKTLGYEVTPSNWVGVSGDIKYNIIAPEHIEDAVPPTTRADLVDDNLIRTFRQLRAWYKFSNIYLRQSTVAMIKKNVSFKENLTPCEQRALKEAGFKLVRLTNGFDVHPPAYEI